MTKIVRASLGLPTLRAGPQFQNSKTVLVIWYWNLIFCNAPTLHYSNSMPHEGKTRYLESNDGELLTSRDICNGTGVCTTDHNKGNKARYTLPSWTRDESPWPQ